MSTKWERRLLPLFERLCQKQVAGTGYRARLEREATSPSMELVVERRHASGRWCAGRVDVRESVLLAVPVGYMHELREIARQIVGEARAAADAVHREVEQEAAARRAETRRAEQQRAVGVLDELIVEYGLIGYQLSWERQLSVDGIDDVIFTMRADGSDFVWRNRVPTSYLEEARDLSAYLRGCVRRLRNEYAEQHRAVRRPPPPDPVFNPDRVAVRSPERARQAIMRLPTTAQITARARAAGDAVDRELRRFDVEFKLRGEQVEQAEQVLVDDHLDDVQKRARALEYDAEPRAVADERPPDGERERFAGLELD